MEKYLHSTYLKSARVFRRGKFRDDDNDNRLWNSKKRLCNIVVGETDRVICR